MADDDLRLDALAHAAGRAYDAAVREALADRSLTRLEHRMLGIVAVSPLSWEVLERRMPGTPAPGALTDAWNSLAARGYAEEVDGQFSASDAGRDVLADADDVLRRVHTRATAGVSEADRAATIAVLGRVLENLED